MRRPRSRRAVRRSRQQIDDRRRTDAGSTPKRASAAGSGSNDSQVSPPGASNTALRVPGTRVDHVAHRRAERLEPLRDRARSTRTPTGVRTPVAIMSMRARAGAVQALRQPGRLAALSSSSISSAVVRGVASGQTSAQHALQRRGRPARVPARGARIFGHSSRGRSRIVVSAIEYGAGSVAVSARPTLPNTVATSSNWLIAKSCQKSCRAACSARHARQGGRHVEEVALVDARQELAAQARDDRQARHQRQPRGRERQRRPAAARSGRTGGRARTRPRVSGLSNSGITRPRSSRSRSAGASVSVTSAADSDDQRLGQRERAQQPPGLAREREHGQERQRRDHAAR